MIQIATWAGVIRLIFCWQRMSLNSMQSKDHMSWEVEMCDNFLFVPP